MNCSRFYSHIHLLFDESASEKTLRAMNRHMDACPACAEYYRQCRAAFQQAVPNNEIHAPAELKARILKTAAAQPAPHRTFRPYVKPLLAAAAILILLFTLFDPVQTIRARAAEKLFRNAALSLAENPSMYMEINVRTRPNDNFADIDSRLPYVPHHLWVVPGPPEKWRFEKQGGRIVVNDGSQIRAWIPQEDIGWILPPDTHILEGFRILLDPAGLMRYEEAYVSKHKQATSRKEVGLKTITLTVEAPAEGDFTNDYLRNTSVDSSDSRREHRFDRATGRLTGMRISVRTDDREISVIDLERIDYDAAIPDTLFTLSKEIQWLDLTRPIQSREFVGITADQAAAKLIGAMQSWNIPLLSAGMPSYNLDLMKKEYAGCKLLKIEKSFRSGNYAGVFVPCTILRPDGQTERIILALRNDNEEQAWIADGGF